MLFSSITFLVFFLPITLTLYYVLPNRIWKNMVLFIVSLLFYAWGEPKFVFLMLASIVFNYIIGLRLENDSKWKKPLLAFAILANIGVLFIFKYLGFTCKIIDILLTSLKLQPLTALNLVMPIGISFYTFQEISYLVDVYRNPELAQKNLLKLGLYITFFPQLIAGPIVRYHDINEQIESRKESIPQFANGLERFILGLSKKILIANSMAIVADKIYEAQIMSYGTYLSWIAAIAYTLQIYYDFSGYSDMAIGLARMFGFELLENFNYPYAASSITDFWKRWHISLTNFFRDYVYIPLGGNRKGKARTILNRFIVFFTTGLWHGAAFNFVLWGLAHGTLMTAERSLVKNEQSIKENRSFINRFASTTLNVLHRAFTLLAVLLLWVLFRTGTKDSIKIALKMFGVNCAIFGEQAKSIIPNPLLPMSLDAKFFILASIGILFSFPWWRKIKFFYSNNEVMSTILMAVKYFSLGCLLLLCYANLADNSYNPFIYFRF